MFEASGSGELGGPTVGSGGKRWIPGDRPHSDAGTDLIVNLEDAKGKSRCGRDIDDGALSDCRRRQGRAAKQDKGQAHANSLLVQRTSPIGA
jgi:hypothetical protein